MTEQQLHDAECEYEDRVLAPDFSIPIDNYRDWTHRDLLDAGRCGDDSALLRLMLAFIADGPDNWQKLVIMRPNGPMQTFRGETPDIVTANCGRTVVECSGHYLEGSTFREEAASPRAALLALFEYLVEIEERETMRVKALAKRARPLSGVAAFAAGIAIEAGRNMRDAVAGEVAPCSTTS